MLPTQPGFSIPKCTKLGLGELEKADGVEVTHLTRLTRPLDQNKARELFNMAHRELRKQNVVMQTLNGNCTCHTSTAGNSSLSQALTASMSNEYST